MSTPHTPGPWHIEPLQWDHGASIAICGKGSYVVATIAPENEEDEPDMDSAKRGPCDEANARLIAAAPELHEALEKLLNAHNEAVFICGTDDEAMVESLLLSARDALNKAEGTTP